MAGITTKVSRVDETMPPIIGTAMRCMTSEPVPLLHNIGSSPAMMAATVHHLGPHALDRSFPDRRVQITRCERSPFSGRHLAPVWPKYWNGGRTCTSQGD